MLIHILKIIKNNLRANLLLVAGIFVIATSLWYAVDYVYAVAVNGQKSLGFEWENVYYIQVGVLPQESLERDTTTRSSCREGFVLYPHAFSLCVEEWV